MPVFGILPTGQLQQLDGIGRNPWTVADRCAFDDTRERQNRDSAWQQERQKSKYKCNKNYSGIYGATDGSAEP